MLECIVFVFFAGKVFQQIIGISMGINCTLLLANILVFLYFYEAEFIKSLISIGRNGNHLSSTSHIDTSMTYCPIITQTLRIISVRCIPLSLRSKTRPRTTRLLPTWIYSCQSITAVNFTLPFTTSVTILISIL